MVGGDGGELRFEIEIESELDNKPGPGDRGWAQREEEVRADNCGERNDVFYKINIESLCKKVKF